MRIRVTRQTLSQNNKILQMAHISLDQQDMSAPFWLEGVFFVRHFPFIFLHKHCDFAQICKAH